MRNLFRCTPDRSLDRIYLRTCAIYRLLKHGHIGQAQALEMSNRPLRRAYKRPDYLRGTIEIWKAGPIRNMRP